MRRDVFAFIAGGLGAFAPSHIDPRLLGAIFAGIVVKVFVGDYDKGFQWTLSDIVFWIVTLTEGALGAMFASALYSALRVRTYASSTEGQRD